MREALWRLVASILTRPAVTARLVAYAHKHPYSHIGSADGADVYMYRHWVFNPYGKDATGEPTPARWSWLPSVRLHRIMRPDADQHLHSHPWNARTIILEGWYKEQRPAEGNELDLLYGRAIANEWDHSYLGGLRLDYRRLHGYTGRLLYGQYHRITQVSDDGVLTLFFTWRKRGSGGFMVDGVKVPWREYLGIK